MRVVTAGLSCKWLVFSPLQTCLTLGGFAITIHSRPRRRGTRLKNDLVEVPTSLDPINPKTMKSRSSAGRAADSRSSVSRESSGVLHRLKPKFLEGLTPHEFKLVVEAAEYRRFPANYVVTNQDHPAKHLYLLLTGRARYFFVSETGQKVILLWIPPGEIFGPAALLVPPTGYHISAETITNCSVLVWDRATIRSLAARYPRLIDNVLPLMLRYLTAYRAAHIALLCRTAQERLGRVLINLAHGIGRNVRGGVELTIRNEELANEANITLFTTSRLLNQWQRAGLLVKSYGKILLRSPERLLRHEQ